jgi:phospholipase/carboxylesterase
MNNEEKPGSEGVVDEEAVILAISSFLPLLLNAFDTLGHIGRHIHPPTLTKLLDNAGAGRDILREHLDQFLKIAWPEHLLPFRTIVDKSARYACNAFDGLATAKSDSNGILAAYRALGQYTKAVEALYPLATTFPPINRFYIEELRRGDEVLLEKLAAPYAFSENLGVMHEKNERSERGGYSVYVPEYYKADQAMPLIMALHGGSGHGRNFLWTWLKAARSHGAILVCPSSIEGTWSLTGRDVDSDNLERILKRVSSQWNIDNSRLLLTGMSDGGTFTYLNGFQTGSPFTHLAPVSASFHPMLLEFFDQTRLKNVPLYLTHGVLDWMFSIDVANVANESLKNRGVDVVYRPIADLSHTYPAEENTKIVDWFLQ